MSPRWQASWWRLRARCSELVVFGQYGRWGQQRHGPARWEAMGLACTSRAAEADSSDEELDAAGAAAARTARMAARSGGGALRAPTTCRAAACRQPARNLPPQGLRVHIFIRVYRDYHRRTTEVRARYARKGTQAHASAHKGHEPRGTRAKPAATGVTRLPQI